MPDIRRKIAVATVLCLALSLAACGRRGALEPPPGEPGARAENSVVRSKAADGRTNTFFNPNVTPEVLPKDDLDPLNQPINPQLGIGGSVAPLATRPVRTNQPGILPVNGGRRAKRILPPQDSFILDPLL